ncbi:MAG: hypothetical protein QM658_06275 [Gordonia sp. (in: high G+C Gram-positive bacteria)]
MIEKSKSVGCGLVGGGLLLAVGGLTHPRGRGDTKDEYLGSMLDQGSWAVSHLASCLGLVVVAASYVIAFRGGTFGPKARGWLVAAAVGAGLAAGELMPHLAAASEHDDLVSGGATPILDAHLLMQTLATPALGLTTAALAVVIARSTGTVTSRVLAVVAVVCGIAYALAGPLVVLTDGVRFAVLFPAQAGIATWYLGTGLGLLAAKRATAQLEATGVRR